MASHLQTTRIILGTKLGMIMWGRKSISQLGRTLLDLIFSLKNKQSMWGVKIPIHVRFCSLLIFSCTLGHNAWFLVCYPGLLVGLCVQCYKSLSSKSEGSWDNDVLVYITRITHSIRFVKWVSFSHWSEIKITELRHFLSGVITLIIPFFTNLFDWHGMISTYFSCA